MVDKLKLVIKKARNGRGIFLETSVKKGTIITVFNYPILKGGKDGKPFINLGTWLQVGPNNWMKPLRFLRFLNHSCSPNCGLKIIGKKAKLVAIRDIKAGEELTFDYSTTMYRDTWSMKCNCGSSRCRYIISNFDSLPKRVQNEYKRLGIVPKYVYIKN